MRRAILVAVAMSLSGCGEFGGSGDYWLEQRSLSEEWNRVARVSGYSDNKTGCLDLAAAMRERVKTALAPAQFRCVPAG
jgi:hypothetical protein